MEIADVRKRIKDSIDRSRRQAADRRVRNSEAHVAYERFLSVVAVPVSQQVAGSRKAEGAPFVGHTPGGASFMSKAANFRPLTSGWRC